MKKLLPHNVLVGLLCNSPHTMQFINTVFNNNNITQLAVCGDLPKNVTTELINNFRPYYGSDPANIFKKVLKAILDLSYTELKVVCVLTMEN